MSVIKLKIEEIGSDGELGNIVNYVLDTQTNSNVSNTSYKVDVSGVFDVLDIATEGSSGISMASDDGSDDLDLVFDENDNLSSYAVADGTVEDEENPSEFIWGVVPEDGKYSVKLTFEDAKDLRHILIYGDSVVGQFPTEAIINGSTTIINTDNIWYIDFGEPSDTQTIEFTKWNLVNYNACLTRIMVSIRYLELGREFVKSFTSLSQSTTSPSAISYGVMANSGTAEINDINSELKGYIDEGIIENSNMKIELYVNDNKVQTHTTTDSSYVEEDKILKLQLTNGLSKWNEITYVGRPLTSAMYADELLIEVLKTLEYSDEQIEKSLSNLAVFGVNNVTGTIKDYLHTIKIPYPYLKSGTYRETINKFCDLAQLNVYADKDDMPVFVSARPVASVKEMDNAIKVTPAMQISNVSKTIVLKNKYDAINTMATQVVDKVENNVDVGTYTQDDLYSYSQVGLEVDTNTSSGVPPAGVQTINLYMEVKYAVGTAIIPKKKNWNLEQVQSVDSGLNSENKPNITHNLTGTKTVYSGSSSSQEEWSGQIANYGEFVYRYMDYELTKVSLEDKTNLTTVKVIDNGDNYSINFKVAIQMYAEGVPDTTNGIYVKKAIQYKADELSIYFYGQKRTISFEDIDASSINVTTARTVANLNNNELRQTKTLIGSTPIVDNIKSNIFRDYKKGVQSGSVDLFAGNFNNSRNTQLVSFKKGELIKPYDIVYFEGDKKLDGSQRYWRVTGNNFKYESEPTNPLEIQEIATIYDIPKFTVTFPSSVTVYNGNTEITSGSQVEGGTKLRVKMYYNDITLEYLRVNGIDISNNSYFVLSENTTITTKYLRTIEIEGNASIDSFGSNDYHFYYNFGSNYDNYTINSQTYSSFYIEENDYNTGFVLVNGSQPVDPLTENIQEINVVRYNFGEYDEDGNEIPYNVGTIRLTSSYIGIYFTSSYYADYAIEYGGIYLDVTFEE